MAKRKHSTDELSFDDDVKPSIKQEAVDSDSSSSEDDEEWNAKPKSKGKKKMKVGKKSKEAKAAIDDEREEGEVDDDDDDDFEDEFNDGYDENLMGDEADKRRLAEMTEKEREQELFNRGEKREVLRTRFEIEKKLRLQKKLEQQKRNKDFSESALRSNERRRNMEDKRKQKDTLKALKEQREKKKQKQQKLRAVDVYSSSSDSDDDDDVKKKKSSSSSSSSSSDSSDQSDSDRPSRRSGRKRDDDDYDARDSDDDDRRDNYEFTLEELNTVRMTRHKIEKWCHAPFFNATSVGCFVKVGLGMSRDGQQVYRLCQVMEVSEGPKVYSLDPPKNSIKTNKLYKLRHGKEERSFRLEYISNRDVDANDFAAWKERMERDKVDLPTRGHVESKRKDLQNALNYNYKDSDIDTILKEKEKFMKTHKNYAMMKTQLLKQKEQAEQAGNQDEVQRILDELDMLEERAKDLDKQRTHSIAAISYINERNRLRNILDTEKAIMAAREEQKREGISVEDDPFRRRTCRPTLVHKFNKNKTSAPAEQPTVTPVKIEKVETVTPKPTPDKVSAPPSTASTPANQSVVDLFDAHDFDIQVDLISDVAVGNGTAVA